MVARAGTGSEYSGSGFPKLGFRAHNALAYHIKNQFSVTFKFRALSGLVKIGPPLEAYVLRARH